MVSTEMRHWISGTTVCSVRSKARCEFGITGSADSESGSVLSDAGTILTKPDGTSADTSTTKSYPASDASTSHARAIAADPNSTVPHADTSVPDAGPSAADTTAAASHSGAAMPDSGSSVSDARMGTHSGKSV